MTGNIKFEDTRNKMLSNEAVRKEYEDAPELTDEWFAGATLNDPDDARYFVGIDELKREVQKEHDFMLNIMVVACALTLCIGYIIGLLTA